jgi:hypothetical protein
MAYLLRQRALEAIESNVRCLIDRCGTQSLLPSPHTGQGHALHEEAL